MSIHELNIRLGISLAATIIPLIVGYLTCRAINKRRWIAQGFGKGWDACVIMTKGESE